MSSSRCDAQRRSCSWVAALHPLGRCADELVEGRRGRLLPPEQLEAQGTQRSEGPGDQLRMQRAARRGQRKGIPARDGCQKRRSGPSPPQDRGDAEPRERVGDGSVVARAITVSGDDDLLALEIVRVKRAIYSQPVTASHEHHPRLAAHAQSTKIGRAEERRREYGIEPPVPKLARQGTAV